MKPVDYRGVTLAVEAARLEAWIEDRSYLLIIDKPHSPRLAEQIADARQVLTHIRVTEALQELSAVERQRRKLLTAAPAPCCGALAGGSSRPVPPPASPPGDA